MKAIGRFFATTDAAIQAVFDRFVFFLMRKFGWPKSIIRYALNAVTILSVVCTAYCDWHVPSWRSNAVVNLLIVAFVLAQQRVQMSQDLQAEKRGMLSLTDAEASGKLGQLTKILFWFFLIYDLLRVAGIMSPMTGSAEELPVLAAWARRESVVSALLDASIIGLVYLARTPRTPPPVEQRVTELVPVPVRRS